MTSSKSSPAPRTTVAPGVATDVKKTLRHLYAPRPGRFEQVDVPPLQYLMVDGAGDPNTTPDYARVVEALYTTSYAIRGLLKQRGAGAHTVAPLEGLWSADDMSSYIERRKGEWTWTMMIHQPDWVDATLVDEAIEQVTARRSAALVEGLRLETYVEGPAVQVLHVGSFDDEGPVLETLHHQVIPDLGLERSGLHHEVYLSDARKTAPEKLRTILRQPVRPLSG